MNTVEIARSWVGTKFHHQGRKKHVGVDCIGLIIGMAHEMGLTVEDRLDYARQPSGGQLEAALANYLQPCDLKVGCVALFKIKNEPQHVGIVSDYGDGFGLIHAYAQSRKVVEHGLDEFWEKRLVACYKFTE